MLRRWLASLRELVTQERHEADLDRELRSHLDTEAAERVEEGTPADEARYAAKRALGHVPTIEAETRASWSWARLAAMLREVVMGSRKDVTYAVRSLRKVFAGTRVIVERQGLGLRVLDYLFVRAPGDRTVTYRETENKYESDHRPLVGWIE